MHIYAHTHVHVHTHTHTHTGWYIYMYMRKLVVFCFTKKATIFIISILKDEILKQEEFYEEVFKSVPQ